MNTEKYQYIKK